jgi:all-trans-retinol 13,14-reductase
MVSKIGSDVSDQTSSHWDLICIGAGITNLAFAAQLIAKYPHLKVLVLDKHLVPGGYSSAFQRPLQQAEFDCSLHKLSGMTDSGNLIRIFRNMGLDLQLKFVFPKDYFEVSFPEGKFTMPNDAIQMKAQLLLMFPSEASGLNQFFSEVETYGKNAYFQFQMMDGSYEVEIKGLIKEVRYAHKHLRTLTVTNALTKLFSNSRLRDILSAPCGYVGGYPDDFGYLYYLHILYATLYCGNAYVNGGAQHLSNTLVQHIERTSSKVLLRTRVEKILFDDELRVTGVVTNRGEFRTQQVYIGASPHHTLTHLFDEHDALKPVYEKLQLLKPSWSTTTLYLVTEQSPRSLGLTSTETFLFDGSIEESELRRVKASESGTEQECESAYWQSPPIELTNYHALSPEGGKVVIMNVLDRIGHWPERRTQAYKDKKKRATTVLLERLYMRYPQFRGQVKYCELSSPRTYLRYTNNTDGAGYGALISTNLSGHGFHHNFPVKGAHFMSAWVAGPSYEAAFGYAEQKVQTWVPERY